MRSIDQTPAAHSCSCEISDYRPKSFTALLKEAAPILCPRRAAFRCCRDRESLTGKRDAAEGPMEVGCALPSIGLRNYGVIIPWRTKQRIRSLHEWIGSRSRLGNFGPK